MRATSGYRGLSFALANLAGYLLAKGNPEEARVFAEEAFARLGEDEHPLRSWREARCLTRSKGA